MLESLLPLFSIFLHLRGQSLVLFGLIFIYEAERSRPYHLRVVLYVLHPVGVCALPEELYCLSPVAEDNVSLLNVKDGTNVSVSNANVEKRCSWLVGTAMITGVVKIDVSSTLEINKKSTTTANRCRFQIQALLKEQSRVSQAK